MQVTFPHKVYKLITLEFTGNYRLTASSQSREKMANEQSNDVSAKRYDKLSAHQREVGQELITVSKVKRGDKILDLGCGTGYFATILSELVGPEGKVVAVDPDAGRISIAKEKYSRANIEYLVESDQTFPEDGYDLVFSNHVLPWIKDKEALFKRIFEKLCPGGRFAFVTFAARPGFPPVMEKAFNELIGPEFLKSLLSERQAFEEPNTYKQLATAAGFEVASSEIKQFTSHWGSVDIFLAYFHGLSQGSFDLSSIDKDILQSFKENHEQELASQRIVRNVLYFVAIKK